MASNEQHKVTSLVHSKREAFERGRKAFHIGIRAARKDHLKPRLDELHIRCGAGDSNRTAGDAASGRTLTCETIDFDQDGC